MTMNEDRILFLIFAIPAGVVLATALELGDWWRWVLAVYLTLGAIGAWGGGKS